MEGSVTGGYVWEWLSLAMQVAIQHNSVKDLADLSFDERLAIDCWAYGETTLNHGRKHWQNGFW